MSGLYGPRRPRPRASAVGTVDHPDGKGRLSTASGPNISQLSFTSGPKSRRAPGRPATLWPRRQGRVPGSARLSDGGADADADAASPLCGLEFNSVPAAAAASQPVDL